MLFRLHALPLIAVGVHLLYQGVDFLIQTIGGLLVIVERFEFGLCLISRFLCIVDVHIDHQLASISIDRRRAFVEDGIQVGAGAPLCHVGLLLCLQSDECSLLCLQSTCIFSILFAQIVQDFTLGFESFLGFNIIFVQIYIKSRLPNFQI